MALLEINQIRKTYATGEVALKGVDISLDGAEIVAVLGLSGSGKSTLLRCINRLVEPDSGTVILDGINITKLNKPALRKARRNLGMIFQEFYLAALWVSGHASPGFNRKFSNDSRHFLEQSCG